MARGRYVKASELAQLETADAFVETLHFMLGLGFFETLDVKTQEGRETRRWIGDRLRVWEDLVFGPEEGEE